MAKGYRPVVRDQVFLLPPDMREWLPEDHPVWLVIEVVGEHLDTSAFHGLRRTGGAGAAGYDPDMLLTVLVWAYAHEVTSSRDMERLCGTDVAFRVICGGNLPDHSTIARFRKDFPVAVGDLFWQVLALCARLGMGKLGVVALDGTKIAASASKAANRTEEGLRKLAGQMVAAHAAADAADDERFGAGRRGDEVPAWSPRRRGERIAAALADLAAEREAAAAAEEAKAAEFRARLAAGQATGPAPKEAEVVLAREGVDREMARQQAKVDAWEQARAAGRRVPRRPQAPEQYCRVRRARAKLDKAQARAADRKTAQDKAAGKDKAPVRNITDPDSRLMPTRGGFIQGYNAQNVTSQDGLIIATELASDPADCQWYEPMTGRAQHAAALIGAHRAGLDCDDSIGLVLADAGYCSEDNLTCAGPDRLIATAKRHDLEKAARTADRHHDSDDGAADQDTKALAAMAARLATGDGIAAYRRRGHIAETPHGHIKHNMGFRQLTMRGKTKAQAEWTFTCAVHNLFKAISTGHLTGQALTTLAG
jgi:transposase